MQGPHGIILLAHGSRDARWHAPVQAVAQRVAQIEPTAPVRCAYLELSPPDLASAVRDLANEGVHRISVLPLFLGLGKHLREDLPRLLDAQRIAHPKIAFTLLPSVGENPRLIELLAQLALA